MRCSPFVVSQDEKVQYSLRTKLYPYVILNACFLLQADAGHSEMTRGRQLPANSKVRRRLFTEDESEKQKPTWKGNDYLSNIIKTEYIAQNFKNEVILKGMKWNFDFENEQPMFGPIVWYRKGAMGEWVGMQKTGRTIHMRKRNRDPNIGMKVCHVITST